MYSSGWSKERPHWSKPRKYSKQLQTHNQPADDVENINCTNMGRDLSLANQPQIFP